MKSQTGSTTQSNHSNRIQIEQDIVTVFGWELPKKNTEKKRRQRIDTVKAFIDTLDHPEDTAKCVIHVAGTNGKGSTCATIEALLIEHGISTGLFTSPHLISVVERFRINGKNAEINEIINILNFVDQKSRELNISLSYFEAILATGLLYFKEKNVDVIILETGLGGRLDATNTAHTDIQVITHINLDHTDWLGNSIEQIAKEKAGIIKQNGTVITANKPEIAGIISQKAKQENANYTDIAKTTKILNQQYKNNLLTFDYQSDTINIPNLESNLIGAYQSENIALAIKTVEKACEKKLNTQVDPEKIKTASKKINWPARVQIINQDPLIILDGSHNPAGIETFIETLKKLDVKKPEIFTAMKHNKDIKKAISSLQKFSPSVTYIESNIQNLASIDEIRKDFPNIRSIQFEDLIRKIQKKEPAIITGSLYLAGEILKNLHDPLQ